MQRRGESSDLWSVVLLSAMNPTLTFTVSPEEISRRLDIYLRDRLPELTRSSIKNLLEKGRILVNGSALKAGYRVKAGDRIEVFLPEPEPVAVEPEPIPLEIIHEDDDIVVINKPPFIAVHPGAGRRKATLVSALLHHTERLSNVGGPLRPGIVHRLDKDTSGVMVVARTNPAHLALSRQFKDHTTKKTYVAVVWGVVKRDEGTIDLVIGRDSAHRKRFSTRTKKGRKAVTRFRVLERFQGFTLLELMPLTGRTHQLRVHLCQTGHPIVGDPLYGRRTPSKRLPTTVREALGGIRRQLLHALTLGFVHPGENRYVEYRAEIPGDIKTFIEILRKECR